ncbi:hypothetical protein [Noviherbaspirillum sp. Root189]|uniref:hypothetical protein n=1 Tax=Noviherbaspirillum sp. Root189 TaxID=1736487 RepID=UPI000708C21A|nr:hypothetical protein [Noviherbaspirillum sp. Root189]KRB85145.1 hypothetical protein ASE07_21520 [Noviherbaspirillum sp. Root189]
METRTANVFALDAARERRKYIAIAEANEHWIQTKACFALSGIELTDDHAERAGRLIADDLTLPST